MAAKRNKRLVVQLTKDEHRRLRLAAKALNLTMSDLARTALVQSIGGGG